MLSGIDKTHCGDSYVLLVLLCFLTTDLQLWFDWPRVQYFATGYLRFLVFEVALQGIDMETS